MCVYCSIIIPLLTFTNQKNNANLFTLLLKPLQFKDTTLIFFNVFTPRQGNVTAFFTQGSPLSNHYPTAFTFEGKEFKSSEQCFQKAVYIGDNDSADRIMKLNNPVEAEQIGKRIANFNARMWMKVAEDCMFKAILAKFSQEQAGFEAF